MTRALDSPDKPRIGITIGDPDGIGSEISLKSAVAGLNPRAGEGGLFGLEEIREIAPAIEECKAEYHIDVAEPFSADTVFARASRSQFDAVVPCYHDQGLIAVKCLAFGQAVNATLSLPIIRTSVDHGTAFDIAGRGVAEPVKHDGSDKTGRPTHRGRKQKAVGRKRIRFSER